MFELWDADSRNVIRFFRDALEAEEVLSNHVRNHGPAFLDGLTLIHEDEHENSKVIAEGQAILPSVERLKRDGESITASSTPRQRMSG